jgi:hypothetical protein
MHRFFALPPPKFTHSISRRPIIHRLPRIIGGRAALWAALFQPLCSADARRLNRPRARAEPARFDLAYCLLDARDQIVANSFLLRQRVVNASELVAHLHENVLSCPEFSGGYFG